MNVRKILQLAMVFSALLFMPLKAAEPLHYISQTSVNTTALLPPPPAADSEETQAELDLILRLQDTRTPQQVSRVKADAKTGMQCFQGVMGTWFAPENLPLTEKLLKDTEKDSKYFTETSKSFFNRQRPMFVHKRIKVVIEGQEEPSYPSGHATRGMLLALVLSELAPDKRADLMRKGWEIGWDRVIAGVHYPSDIVAGRVLGQALARTMLGNPAFAKDLAAAKSEFTAARTRFAAR